MTITYICLFKATGRPQGTLLHWTSTKSSYISTSLLIFSPPSEGLGEVFEELGKVLEGPEETKKGSSDLYRRSLLI